MPLNCRTKVMIILLPSKNKLCLVLRFLSNESFLHRLLLIRLFPIG